MNNVTDWKHRVGADAWKQVIHLECEIVDKLFRERPLTPREPQEQHGQIKFEAPLEWEIVRADTEAQSPFSVSYLLFQAGRLFVVGPTKKAITRIQELQSDHQALCPKHIHIVFLTWHEQHVEGLISLAQSFPNPSNITVWTSFWIWEELRISGAVGDVPWTKMKLFDSEKECLIVDPTHPSQSKNKQTLNQRVVAFHREKEWELTMGVTLRLSYSICVEPFLRAEFRCNNHRIVIDPALQGVLAGALHVESKSGMAESKEIAEDLQPLMEACLENARRFPSLADDTLRRWAEMHRLVRQFRAAPIERDTEITRDVPPTLGLWREHTFGLEEDTYGVYLPTSVTRFRPLLKGRTADILEPRISIAREKSLDKTVVVLLCGGFMNKTERGLINPAFPLDISVQYANDECDLETMSILEWRLRQLGALAQSNASLLPVLLLTTPETDQMVRDVKERCRERFPKEVEMLQIRQYAARLAGGRQTDLDAAPKKATVADGGWRLRPLGHIDALRLLDRWKEEHPNKHTNRSLAMIFALNNLGGIINETTVRFLNALDHDNTTDMAVELFEYQQPAGSDDKRWPQLSSCASIETPTLTKESYFSPSILHSQSLDSPSKRWYSSLTWYVKFTQAACQEVLANLEKLGFRKSENLDGGGWCPQQDLDFVAHYPGLRLRGINGHDEQATQIAPQSLYRHKRYLGVRTQDHIRHARFQEQFNGSVGVLPTQKPPPVQLDYPKLLVMAPRAQDYHWGGYEIATLKGFHDVMGRQIAETWEISTYPQGQSGVQVNQRVSVPLQTALRDQRKDTKEGDENLPFMAKYLDCHRPLSVQVHPTSQTASWLYNLVDERGKSLLEALKLRDSAGKEESFFVLRRAPAQQCHLYLGFERQTLIPMARQIALALHEKAYQFPRQSNLEEDLAEIWRKIGQGLNRHVIHNGLLDALFAPDMQIDKEKCSGELLALFAEGAKGETLARQKQCEAALRFHLLGPGEDESAAHCGRLRGKELLYVAIGLVALMWELSDFVNAKTKNLSQLSPEEKRALEAFQWRARLLLGQAEIDSSTFSVHEIRDLSMIVDRLRQQSDPVSSFLWQKLSNSDQEILMNYQPSPQSSDQATSVIVQYLNVIAGGHCIYQRERFEHILLRDEAIDLKNLLPKGPDLVRLNRLLLEDAYPQELHRRSRFSFLQFFHRHTLEEDNCWVRIPPGTVHAWLGGGNLLIEIADRSDNTFRILDYGRELTEDTRDMHYLAAMFSLNSYSFLDGENAGGKFIEKLSQSSQCKTCHHLLDYTVYKMQERQFKEKVLLKHSFIMNPDGNLTVDPGPSPDLAIPHSQIGRCRALLVRDQVNVRLWSGHEDDRVFHFVPHEAHKSLLSLCLGGIQWEASLWQDPQAPAIRWRAASKQPWSMEGDGLKKIGSFIRECLTSPEWKSHFTGNPIRVAVSWPGFRRRLSRNAPNSTDMWFSTSFGQSRQQNDVESEIRGVYGPCEPIRILSDFQAAILGEIHHPMGRLNSRQASLVINISAGVCVAFFHPEISPQGLFQDNDVTQCSAVGRWLYYSLTTGDCQVGTDQRKTLESLVFTSHPTDFSEDLSLMRASKYLGVTGLVARNLTAVAAESATSSYPWGEWCGKSLPERLKQLNDPNDRGAVYEGLRRLYLAVFREAIGAQVVASYAKDLSMLITHARSQLEKSATKRDAGETRGPLTGDQLRRLAKECFKQIVLTGPVGQSFGLNFDANQTENLKLCSDDPLLNALNQRLKDLRIEANVSRSVIRPASERETAGFLHYLEQVPEPPNHHMHVFLSYMPQNTALAFRLADALKEKGLLIWLAEKGTWQPRLSDFGREGLAEMEVHTGDNWAEKTSQALQECQAMVALLTPEALVSDRVFQDIGFALGSMNYRQRVIPVLVGSPGEVSDASIQEVLRSQILRLTDETATDIISQQIADRLLHHA
jgi:hypothetical protein